MLQYKKRASWSDWNSNLNASVYNNYLFDSWMFLFNLLCYSLATHNTCTHLYTLDHWIYQHKTSSHPLHNLTTGKLNSRSKPRWVRIAKPKDSVYQATFPKHAPLTMLYCTRALVDKASNCILLMTWQLENRFSSKNKSITEGVFPGCYLKT